MESGDGERWSGDGERWSGDGEGWRVGMVKGGEWGWRKVESGDGEEWKSLMTVKAYIHKYIITHASNTEEVAYHL